MEDILPLDPLVKGATDLVATGFLGTFVVAFAFAIVYLWRENKAITKQAAADLDTERERCDELIADERSKHSVEITEERKKHSIEMAEQRKLNAELQSDRLAEVKAAFAEVTKALGTVEQALAFMHGSTGGMRA